MLKLPEYTPAAWFAPTVKVPPTLMVAMPEALNDPIDEGELVKVVSCIEFPGPVKVILLGKLIENPAPGFPVK